jgi:hypothetical protein
MRWLAIWPLGVFSSGEAHRFGCDSASALLAVRDFCVGGSIATKGPWAMPITTTGFAATGMRLYFIPYAWSSGMEKIHDERQDLEGG